MRLPRPAALLLLAGLAGCDSEAAAPTEAETPRPVRVTAVEAVDGDRTRLFVGRLGVISTVDVAFRLEGLLLDLPWREGQFVPAGSLLAQLDEAPLRIALREAEARAVQARREFDRQRALGPNVAARAAIEQAETALALREAELARARLHLEHARLIAPFDALLTRRLAEPHSVVSTGAPVLRLQDVTEWRVSVAVPGELLARYGEPGQFRAEALLPGREDAPIPLAFREIRTEPNAVAQTYEVRFGLPRPEGGMLLPGMTVTVRMSVRDGTTSAAVRVPVAAIESAPSGEAHVWVHDAEAGRMRRQPVQLGPIQDGHVLILSGLSAGQQVAVAGLGALSEDRPVRPLAAR